MIEVHEGKFLLMWGLSLSVPIATAIAVRRGQLKGESRRDFRVRVGIGFSCPLTVSGLPVLQASNIGLPLTPGSSGLVSG
jgi:hypothetical protein